MFVDYKYKLSLLQIENVKELQSQPMSEWKLGEKLTSATFAADPKPFWPQFPNI